MTGTCGRPRPQSSSSGNSSSPKFFAHFTCNGTGREGRIEEILLQNTLILLSIIRVKGIPLIQQQQDIGDFHWEKPNPQAIDLKVNLIYKGTSVAKPVTLMRSWNRPETFPIARKTSFSNGDIAATNETDRCNLMLPARLCH
ncbi:hypothetical protein LOAG_08558 [Loa loa]|uniref:Uncharacterized protein n=1 Tax=Loa loa TaxID=7209 RepID=A0A1S0TTJ7_LOALO|nr:hypothetical protein LOAG_08558 [Loa loa]EFO19932.1 hypothetical protein LOAG_08558 [Loa loa]